MYRLDKIEEIKFINHLISGFKKSPLQMNRIHTSDSEIIMLDGMDKLVAITTDGISEEIELNIFTDPYLIGWMVVLMNLSDLAAVGAEPIGLLLNQTFEKTVGSDFINALQLGINDACKSADTFILGGDTNFSSHFNFCATAIGLINGKQYLSRIGMHEGDILYSTSRLGIGNAFAFSRIFVNGRNEIKYLPKPQFDKSKIISRFAASCIDSSDGLFASLDQLIRLNKSGITLFGEISLIICEDAKEICRMYNIPEWLMLAGPVGEYDLIFSIPQNRENEFLKSAENVNWQPVKLGIAVEKPELFIQNKSKLSSVNTAKIRNLSALLYSNPTQFLVELINIYEESF